MICKSWIPPSVTFSKKNNSTRMGMSNTTRSSKLDPGLGRRAAQRQLRADFWTAAVEVRIKKQWPLQKREKGGNPLLFGMPINKLSSIMRWEGIFYVIRQSFIFCSSTGAGRNAHQTNTFQQRWNEKAQCGMAVKSSFRMKVWLTTSTNKNRKV